MKKVLYYSLVSIFGIISILLFTFIILGFTKFDAFYNALGDIMYLEGEEYYLIYRNNKPFVHLVSLFLVIAMVIVMLSSLCVSILLKNKSKGKKIYLIVSLFLVAIIAIIILCIYLYNDVQFINMKAVLIKDNVLGENYDYLSFNTNIIKYLQPLLMHSLLFSFVSLIFEIILWCSVMDSNDNPVVEEKTSCDNSIKSTLIKEIKDMKETLEIEELKNEYKELYSKVNKTTKK